MRGVYSEWIAQLRVLHCLPRKLQDICEELVVLPGELICVFDLVALRKTYLTRPSRQHVASRSLDEMASKNAALLLTQLLHVNILESVIQQTQEGAEATLDATVRGGSEQQDVS